jgi:hypothetical protein
MRPFTPSVCIRSLHTIHRPITSRNQLLPIPTTRRSYTTNTSPTTPYIPTQHIQTSPGVSLTPQQTTLTSSLLSLFSGNPSLAALSLWHPNATFANPLTIATGHKQYSAYWYGLTKAFSTIDRLSFQVKDAGDSQAGNPLLMDLRTRYMIRGIESEQVVQSEVRVWVDGEGMVERVEDRWGGEGEGGVVGNVSFGSSPLQFGGCCR